MVLALATNNSPYGILLSIMRLLVRIPSITFPLLLIYLEGIDATWSWGMDSVFVSRVMHVHGLGRVDLPAYIH